MKKLLILLLAVLAALLAAAMAFSWLYVDGERVVGALGGALGEDFTVTVSGAVFNPLTRTLALEETAVVRTAGQEDREFFRAGEMRLEGIGILAALRGGLSARRFLLRDFYLDGEALLRDREIRHSENGGPPVSLLSVELREGKITFAGPDGGAGSVRSLGFSAGPFEYRPGNSAAGRGHGDRGEGWGGPAPGLFNIEIDIPEAGYVTGDGNYVFAARDVFISESRSRARLGRFTLEPARDEEEWVDLLEFRTERFRFDLAGFEAGQVNFPALRRKGEILAVSAVIDSLDLQVELDRRLPEDPNKAPAPMPAAVFRELPFRFAVGHIEILRADIRYSERAADGERPGTVLFARTNAVLTGADNRSGGDAALQVRTLLEGEGELQVEFTLPLVQERRIAGVKGSLNGFDITLLNSMFTDLEGLRLDKGFLHGLEFEFDMGAARAEGWIGIRYEDLRIRYVDPADHGQSIIDVVRSFFVDSVAVRSSSPGGGSEVRRGEISWDREEKKGFFNYLWKSLRSGIYDGVMRPD